MNKKQFKMSKNLLSALAISAMCIFAVASGSSETEKTENATSNAKINEKGVKENWEYSEDENKMDGTKQYFAQTTSTNQVDFAFPYDGGSNMDIIVRKTGKASEVLLLISKGQFMGSIGGSSKAKVKFDDQSPVSYSYESAGDGSGDVIFLNNATNFISKLKDSKKVMIELTFFNEGNKILEFDTEGLEWDK